MAKRKATTTEPKAEAKTGFPPIGTVWRLEVKAGQVNPFSQKTATAPLVEYSLRLEGVSKLHISLRHLNIDGNGKIAEGVDIVSKYDWYGLFKQYIVEERWPTAEKATGNPASPEATQGKPASLEATQGRPTAPRASHARIQIAAIDIPEGANSRQLFEPEPLLHLGKSMAEVGQIYDVVVIETAGGRFGYIAGERRIRAARERGETLIDAKVFPQGSLDELAIRRMHMASDRHAVAPDPMADAREYRAHQALGRSVAEIAADAGVSDDVVRRRLELLELPVEVQHYVEAGTLSARAALVLLKMKDKAGLVELARRAVAEKLGEKELQQFVEAENAGQLLTEDVDNPASPEATQGEQAADEPAEASVAAEPEPVSDPVEREQLEDAAAASALGLDPGLKNPPASRKEKTRAERHQVAKGEADRSAAIAAGAVFTKPDDEALTAALKGKGQPVTIVLSGRLKVDKAGRVYLGTVLVTAKVSTESAMEPKTLDRVDAVPGLERAVTLARKHARKNWKKA